MTRANKPSTRCPCGSGGQFAKCCAPLLRRQREATTAEQLMRSRYSAFVKRNSAYLRYSWHPDTAPESIGDLPDGPWAGLEVVATSDGTKSHDRGTVEFRSNYTHGDHEHTIHEVSRFARFQGRWVYIDGESARP